MVLVTCESSCEILGCGMVGEDEDEDNDEEDEEGEGEKDDKGEGADEFVVGGIKGNGHKRGKV